MKNMYSVGLICLFLILSVSIRAQEVDKAKSFDDAGIEIWLPEGWMSEKGESLNANDPESKILMMFYPALNEKIEGTPTEYGQRIMSVMFKNYKETSKPTDNEIGNLVFTEIIGKGSLHGDEMLTAKMYITDITETYHLFIILSGKEKDIKKLQPQIDEIFNKL